MIDQHELAYKKILAHSLETTLLGSVESVLAWDQETYMPSAAIELRSKQLEMLAHLVHKHHTSPKFKKLLNSLIDLEHGTYATTSFTEGQLANLREWRRDYLKMAKLPSSFVKTFARTTSQAQHVWAEAKRTNRFDLFQPYLDKIILLNRKKANFLGFQEHPYDALIDLYEPDMTVRELTPIFARLKLALMTLLREIASKPAPHRDFLHKQYPPHQQMQFAHLLLKTMGFEPETSRLDLSMHPFCSCISPNDTRMTTHVHHEDPMANFFAVLHEGGHGLYGLGRPIEHFGSPLSESVSLGVDESQSRFWETIIGHSLPFWHYFFPLLEEQFPDQLGGIDLETFHRAINSVRPSLIRIHSDEVTYSLHIIIRFELEKALIEGSLKSKELPEAWNEKMREYLGVAPSQDSEGCLQDIHWSMGAMGYFPTYTLGNLYAAQIFSTFKKKYPQWETKVAQGDLRFIRDWLKSTLHCCGRLYPPRELMQKITGQPLNEQPYLDYLNEKFRSLYKL
ncbi:MAG: carboxypeptidase M32 [Simkania sp.]|nr:carboxypeptidase M32 [Simkania sp.]